VDSVVEAGVQRGSVDCRYPLSRFDGGTNDRSSQSNACIWRKIQGYKKSDGTKAQDLSTLFNGPTAIAYSSDPVAAAKVAVKFAKENENLVVLGGSFNGQILDVDAVATLAKLPSLDELRGKVLALINTPATRITGILQAPAAQVARVISAHAASEKAA
jgi:ribosomal protein L10